MLRPLIIQDVDLDMLEEQRKELATIELKNLTRSQGDALTGIQNMLDHWSDKIACNNMQRIQHEDS